MHMLDYLRLLPSAILVYKVSRGVKHGNFFRSNQTEYTDWVVFPS